MTSISLVLALSGILFASAQTPPVPIAGTHPAAGERVKSPPAWERFTKIYGTEIPRTKGGVGSFAYVHANEKHGHLFEACMGKIAGALITVGTFRGLNMASSGKVKHVVLFDYDAYIRLFNLVNLQLMEKAGNRYEYLSLLLTGKIDEPLVKEAIDSHSAVTPFVHRLLAHLITNPTEPEKRWKWKVAGNQIPDGWKKLGVELPDQESWQSLYEVPPDSDIPVAERGKPPQSRLAYQLLNRIPDSLASLEKLGTIGETIFGSDQRFSTAQKMVKEGHVSVVQGDLTKPETMAAVNGALKKAEIPISAVDVSNVMSYGPSIMSNRESENGKAFYQGMRSNFDSLNYTPDARIFFTNHNTVFRDGSEHFPTAEKRHSLRDLEQWYYFSLSPKDLPQLDAVFKNIEKDPDHAYEGFQVELDKVFEPAKKVKDQNLLFTGKKGKCP